MTKQTSVSWLLEQIREKICGRRQENEAAWETKLQRIDTEINKKNVNVHLIATIIA